MMKATALPIAAIPMPPPMSIMEPLTAGVCGLGAATGGGMIAPVVMFFSSVFCTSVLLVLKKRSACLAMNSPKRKNGILSASLIETGC